MESGSWFPSIKSDLDEIKDFTFPIMSDSHMSHMQINSMQFFKNCYLFCQHFIEENLVNLCEILKEIYLKCFVRNIRLNNFWCPILQSFVTKKKKKILSQFCCFHTILTSRVFPRCAMYITKGHTPTAFQVVEKNQIGNLTASFYI